MARLLRIDSTGMADYAYITGKHDKVGSLLCPSEIGHETRQRPYVSKQMKMLRGNRVTVAPGVCW